MQSWFALAIEKEFVCDDAKPWIHSTVVVFSIRDVGTPTLNRDNRIRRNVHSFPKLCMYTWGYSYARLSR